MQVKVCIARKESADGKRHLFHPAIRIDEELFVYTLGLRSRVTATRVAAEIGAKLEEHISWWLRENALEREEEIPDFLIDVVT